MSGFDNITTREQFSSSLCSILLHINCGLFCLSKGSIEDCWIRSCDDVDKSKKRIGNGRVCMNRCTYDCKNMSFREKMADLDSRSVSKLSCPFSDIFC